MIEGVVNAAYEAVVTLPLRGPAGQGKEIDAVIDTGYDGYLTVTPALVAELGLPFQSRGRAILANGRRGDLRRLRRHGAVGRPAEIR